MIFSIDVSGYANTFNKGNMELEAFTLAEEVTQLHAEICSALADSRRILLLYALFDKPRNVSELAEFIGISQPAASRHLKILRDRGLVNAVRQGPSVEYYLSDERLIDALNMIRDILNDRLIYQASLIEDSKNSL
jgi:ArsR family transcriptional regulator